MTDQMLTPELKNEALAWIASWQEKCEGYKKLLADVERDVTKSAGFHDYHGKLVWVISRAIHYSDKTGIPVSDILNSWEKTRSYWYMNFYQDSNQPLIENEKVRVFNTTKDLMDAIGDKEFRCPACEGITSSPYECNSGKELQTGKVCDWKVYGLFKDLGKGIYIFVKDRCKGERIFMPVAWELNSDRRMKNDSV